MKRTGNQKVVTAAKWLLLAVFANLAKTSKTEISALSAPYRACTALPDNDIIHAVTRENRGLWRVCIGIPKSGKAVLVSSPISNRDIIAGCLPGNFRVAALPCFGNVIKSKQAA